MQIDTSNLQAFYFTDWDNSYIPNILEEIYRDKVYEPFLAGKKDLTIVEIGANIGLVSYYFSKFAKVVYSIEPAKRHIACIEAMAKQNNINNIKLCPFAISNTNGEEKFYHNPNVTMYSLEDTVNNKDDFEMVQTKTLDVFVTENNIDQIDLLKLDCEGSEGKVVSSDGFREVASKIKVIVGEHHNWCGMSQAQFANCLEDLGFDFKWTVGTEAQVFTAVRRENV